MVPLWFQVIFTLIIFIPLFEKRLRVIILEDNCRFSLPLFTLFLEDFQQLLRFTPRVLRQRKQHIPKAYPSAMGCHMWVVLPEHKEWQRDSTSYNLGYTVRETGQKGKEWLLGGEGGLLWWSEQKKRAGEVKKDLKTRILFDRGILQLFAQGKDPCIVIHSVILPGAVQTMRHALLSFIVTLVLLFAPHATWGIWKQNNKPVSLSEFR